MKDRLVNGLNLVLMADIFLVLFAFFWWVVALLGRAADLPLGLDLWYKLWQPVFTPAIGILMLGAIATGIIPQIQKWLTPNQK